MSACTDCTAAAAKPWHGFTHGCLGCAARAVARGANFRRAMKDRVQDWRYRTELEQLKVTHEQVKAAGALDVLASEETA